MPTSTGRLAASLLTMAVLASCSSSTDQAAPATTAAATTAGPTENTAPAPDAAEVVEAFRAARLPVPNPRDNSAKTSCTDIGCAQLVTTDAVSVYVFADESSATRWAEALGPDGGHREGLVVLNYTTARTPAADQPRYEQVLRSLSGG